MSKSTITSVDKALSIVNELVRARAKWGSKNLRSPYTSDQLYDALATLAEAGHFDGSISSEEATKLRRQLAACLNREKVKSNKGVAAITDEVVKQD